MKKRMVQAVLLLLLMVPILAYTPESLSNAPAGLRSMPRTESASEPEEEPTAPEEEPTAPEEEPTAPEEEPAAPEEEPTAPEEEPTAPEEEPTAPEEEPTAPEEEPAGSEVRPAAPEAQHELEGESELSEPETPLGIESREMIVLNDTSVVVGTFSELSAALSSNNGYTHIYLSDDIALTSGITIHTSKKSLVVDGINPLDPQKKVHTLSDQVIGLTGTIGVRSNAGTKDITVRNLNMIGKNFYGIFMTETLALGVTITYENVDYQGCQLVYNRYGLVRLRDVNILIDRIVTGSDARQEVAECAAVEFEGRVRITHTSDYYSCFWLLGPGSWFRLLPGAHVTLEIDKREAIFCDLGAVDFEVGRNAVLNINSLHGLTYLDVLHRLGSLSMGENAEFYLNKREQALLEPALRIQDRLELAPGSRLHVFAPYSSTVPLVQFTTNSTSAVFQDPDSVILYSGGNAPLFKWPAEGGFLRLYSPNISLWRAAAPLSVAGGLDDPPAYRWQKPAHQLITIEATLNTSSNITSMNTNYTASDGPDPLDADTFSISPARVLAFGRLPLTLGEVMEGESVLIGATREGAALRAEYRLEEAARSAGGTADESGLFRLDTPDPLPAGLLVDVAANRDFLTRKETVEVRKADGLLQLIYLPEQLNFQTSVLAPESELIRREDGAFRIVVGDSRPAEADWRLTASLLQPMTAVHGKVLRDALVYVDGSGTETALNDMPTLIAQKSESGPGETILDWLEDEGILLRVNPDAILAGHPYRGLILWTLTDGP